MLTSRPIIQSETKNKIKVEVSVQSVSLSYAPTIVSDNLFKCQLVALLSPDPSMRANRKLSSFAEGSPSKTSKFGDISRRSLLAQYQPSMVLSRDRIGSPGRLRSSFLNRSRLNSQAEAPVFSIEPQQVAGQEECDGLPQTITVSDDPLPMQQQ